MGEVREILFRGKRVSDGEWVEGNYEWYHKPQKHIISNPYTGETKGVIPETVGQYIGITDKNGKKIFTGDIVRFTDSLFNYSETGIAGKVRSQYGVIYKEHGCDAFHLFEKTSTYRDMGASELVTYSYEVLGNVFDNPELIKEDKQ